VKKAAGVSVSLATDEPRSLLKVSMLVLREVREVWGEMRGSGRDAGVDAAGQ
jgi:hypothetical protein